MEFLQVPAFSYTQQNPFYRKGDMVRVVFVPNSRLNVYKGYIGEVRDYKRGQDFALVFLHALNDFQLIKFPLEHLKLIN